MSQDKLSQILKTGEISHDWDGSQVSQRATDGYWNLTEMCAAHGKRVDNFLRLDATRELLEEFDLQHQNLNPSDLRDLTPAIVASRGRTGGGTWGHPEIAIYCAQWCNPKFALAVSRAIINLPKLAEQATQREQVVRLLVALNPSPWCKRFEDDYYHHLYRLWGKATFEQYHGRHKTHPSFFGCITNKLIYDRLPTAVSEPLKQARKDSGCWHSKLHQFLTPTGIQVFEQHMTKVFAYLQAASSLEQVYQLLDASQTGVYQLHLLLA